MAVHIYKDNKELANLVRQRSREGFEQLYACYAAALYGNIRQMIKDEETAGNVLEETITYAWVNIGQYDEKENFFTWLLFICRRLCKQYLHSKQYESEKLNTGESVRSIMELIVRKGKDYDEVARIMDVPASTVLKETRKEYWQIRKDGK